MHHISASVCSFSFLLKPREMIIPIKSTIIETNLAIDLSVYLCTLSILNAFFITLNKSTIMLLIVLNLSHDLIKASKLRNNLSYSLLRFLFFSVGKG